MLSNTHEYVHKLKTRKQMKRNFFLTSIIIFSTTACFGAMTTGFVIREIVTGDMIERDPLNYATDQQAYTTGGITFTYPSNWFTVPPFIQISVIQNSPHSTNEAYVAEVSANSAGATTVMVYHINFGVVTDAPSNSVTVCLLAFEDPV